MSNEDEEDDFNQCYIFMEEKEVDKKYQSFACINDLDDLIKMMNWNLVMDRVKEKHKVRYFDENNNNLINDDPPLEVECPHTSGDLPLFQCLRHEQVPFDAIKVMTGKHVHVQMNKN